MKKISNILIVLSVLLTPHFVVQAYQARGYFAVGGEWLVPLVVILVIYGLVPQVRELWRVCLNSDD